MNIEISSSDPPLPLWATWTHSFIILVLSSIVFLHDWGSESPGISCPVSSVDAFISGAGER